MTITPGIRRLIVAATATGLAAFTLPAAHAGSRLRCAGKRATIVGTGRREDLTGTPGDDVIVGRGGDDLIVGRGGSDTVCGGTGSDFISGGAEADDLHGGSGDDNLRGGDGDDLIRGGQGADFLTGGTGNDELAGATNPFPFIESLMGGPGDDHLLGGEGLDRALYFDSPAAVQVDLGAGTAVGDGTDDMFRVEGVIGSNFDDILIGDDSPNGLVGGPGNDVIRGLDSGRLDSDSDLLFGAEGNDDIDGGTGFDFASYDAGCLPVTLDLVAETATGGQGDDALNDIEGAFGSDCADTLIGDEGENGFVPLGGDDSIFGGQGPDTVFFFFTFGPVTANLSNGLARGDGAGADGLAGIEHLRGTAWGDLLIGNWKDNSFLGGFGNDALVGAGGDDFLNGEFGVDRVDGGDGADTCSAERTNGCETEQFMAAREAARTFPWSDSYEEMTRQPWAPRSTP
jgi:Ca2+-binding RTX toxin-like protein